MPPVPRSRGLMSKPDLVSTTLVYPITLTTDSATGYGFSITCNQFAPLSQNGFQIQNSSSAIRFLIATTGGLVEVASDLRVKSTPSGPYAAFNGTETVPCIELPDGTGQGSKVWSGTGAPSSTTVGTATAGDYYFRNASAVASTLVAQEASTAGSTVTSITVGTGSSFKSGAVEAGDLLVVVAANTVASETCTVGADTGITDTTTDGGFQYNDVTRRIHVFSHVVQSGDISAGTVTASAFTNNTGTGRRLMASVFRNEWGFDTTGSKNGCAGIQADDHSDAAITANTTLTATGPSRPSVSVAAMYASGFNAAQTFYWDAGTATNKDSDVPGSGNGNARMSAKPGLGTNTSGATGYTTGGSSCEVSVTTGTWGCILCNWPVKSSPPSMSTLYVCTAGGTPGTWSAVF